MALAKVSVRSADRSLLTVWRFEVRLQAAQNLGGLVVEQPALLASSPFTLFIKVHNLSGCLSQVLAHMVEIEQIRTLRAEVVAKFIDNPGGTIAHRFCSKGLL